MIALNETLESAAEVPFFLPTDANPLVGLTGHVFVLGEVQVRLPGASSYVDVAVAKIREVGHGWYAARLTAVQTTTAGSVLISAVVSGAQPWRGSEVIGTRGGEFGVGDTGYLYFYLPQETDPVYGAPITGYAFDDDDVQVAWPDQVFANVTGSTIVEFGNGFYGVPVSASNTATRGKAYVRATATGAQPFSAYVTILDAQEVTSTVVDDPADPIEVALPAQTVELVDHISIALDRLCQYAREKAA